MASFIMGIVSMTIGVVIVSSVFITTVKNANQTYACNWNGSVYESCTWSSSEIALWGLLTLAGIVGILYGVLNVFGIA